MKLFCLFAGLLITGLAARADETATAVVAPELRLFTLASGDVAGSYYSAASAICASVNLQDQGRMRCSPDPTSGSLYNLSVLRDGQVDFAFAQSDIHRNLYTGTGAFAGDPPQTDLRSVMSLYSEMFTVLASADSGIASLVDLKDKRIDLGPPASGRRRTVDAIMTTLGFQTADFASVSELPQGIAIDALCQGTIDATLLVVGHPNEAVRRAIADCGAVPVRLSSRERGIVIKDSPDMQPSAIREGIYEGVDERVPTVAVVATIVTLASTDPELVAAIVEDTLNDLPLLARRSPVLGDLEPAAMRRTGLTAPLHPGAQAAFDALLGPEVTP